MGMPEFQNAVRTWLTTALAGTDVIYGHQDGPKPPLSFVEVRTIAVVGIGTPDKDPIVMGLTGIQSRRQKYRATLACHFYGPLSMTHASSAHRSLGKSEVSDAFRTALVSVESASGMTHVPFVVNGQWEKRWTFDIFVGMIATDAETIGWIEHVEIEGTIVAGETQWTFDLAVDLP